MNKSEPPPVSGPSGKKVTVIDVAREAGVSKSTVSLVLQGGKGVKAETGLRVKTAMATLGYVYNREAAGLRSRQSNLVSIVANDLANPYLAQVIIALEGYLERTGLVPVVVNINEDHARQQRIVSSLKEYNVAGFLITPAPMTDAAELASLVDAGYPVVCMMREVVGAGVPVVMPDNRLGTYLATRHLIMLGHRHIAFIGGVVTISDYHERRQGYLDAMDEAKIPVLEQSIHPGSTKRQGGKLAAEKALDANPDTSGLVCFSDVVAYGAYTALRERGLVPGEDVSVVGFDDLEDSRLMSPALSTVRVKADDIGKKACELLQQQRENLAITAKTLVGVELVVRGSCCQLC